jgi:hypothetical protein
MVTATSCMIRRALSLSDLGRRRPLAVSDGDKTIAGKRPFTACDKLRPRFMEPSWVARSAQMPLDKSALLIRRFRSLFSS